VISRTILIVAEPLGELSAERVASALGGGLAAGESGLSVDALTVEDPPPSPRAWWGSSDSQERLRSARAVAIVTARLDEHTLAGSLAFEVATAARQAGVPAYAVTAENALNLFDARMLDLQMILQARTPRALRSAGAKLAGLV
jgi:glycerate 2-kinase